VYLGIAVARELHRRDPSCDILFVGTHRGLEARIVPREGFEIAFIESAGLKGMGTAKLLHNLALLPRSLRQSRRVLRRHAPDVVVGVGGYASGPVVFVAWLQHRRTLVIEPNAYPGMTNRWLTQVIDRAALALPDSGNHFGTKGVVTGIPVRAEFSAIPDKKREDTFTVVVYGGSQGSHALNTTVCGALPQLHKLGPALRLIHQTGEKEHAAVKRAHEEAGMQSEVRPFLPAIFEELARADLVISRAGAGTAAELAAAGRPAILVPFPGATDDHQTRNALALQQHGAARMIPEAEWTPGRMCSEIRYFMEHQEQLERMRKAARALAKPDAAATIADMVVSLARSSR
jgi:UDP-N-acetylglucosamine--N-acetylmuramyl-(pentapeptide) pyrophosphoryl-undecaprenol N-acetylglucosamine transferase